MSVLTLKNIKPGERVQHRIEDFVDSAPFRSVIVQVHEPLAATWTANPHVEHPAASLLKVPLVGALLLGEGLHGTKLMT